jgi:acyl dehydratase
MRVLATFEQVAAAVGEKLGTSDWLLVDQHRVNEFANATGDHQWIHVDPERARSGPFGGTIAHGYLTLALGPLLGSQIFSFETPGAKLNYGVNKVRFPHPLRVGSRVRAHVFILAVNDVPTGQHITMEYCIEIEGTAKPACVAETVVLLLRPPR